MSISKDFLISKLHPLVARWFTDRFDSPTPAQLKAWPRISAGAHVLVSAPTGSGKTLTAFLWAINELISGRLDTGETRILYISPLKALNNDIQRNLLEPLQELKAMFRAAGELYPDIRVLTRSGDTLPSERRKMLRRPPEILITTPESINLLLSTRSGQSVLTRITTVILDEIHAVMPSKRGVHLITAVERLVLLSGEFQRIALSATVRPLETVAAFVGGYRHNNSAAYHPRPVAVIEDKGQKQYELQVQFPVGSTSPDSDATVWGPIVEKIKARIENNRSTLVFVNSRRLCEKLTFMINAGARYPIAYAHHGSLSREIRTEVEHKLKSGQLRAIVATHSLEMGIDIGALDEVLMVQSPFSTASAIQRFGRAGHRVEGQSRGAIYPTHSHDLLEAGVLAAAVVRHDIARLRPVNCPLDVLAQILISMTATQRWAVDRLFEFIRCSFPYQTLDRRIYDLVIDMLNGHFAHTRIRELKPKVRLDRIDNTMQSRKGAVLALYMSGGTIPDRGYFQLRREDGGARIGELDEEFVWEARVGQTFTLGTQNWKISRITHNDVFVTPAFVPALSAPFWKAEQHGRDFHFSEAIGRFLQRADTQLEDPAFYSFLTSDCFLDDSAARQLIDYLRMQKKVTGRPLPHRCHLLVEHVDSGPGAAPGNQVILHTFWGARINRPFAMALEAAWENDFQQRLEIYAGNDCIVLLLPHEISAAELVGLVTSRNVEALLRQRLESSGFFGARFRECAGRSLLLSRRKVSERLPLWMSRLRSQKLQEAVLRFKDFPILLETWRTCLQDEFDMDSLERVLGDLESGVLSWTETRLEHPSPFARSVAWAQINRYMYMDDEPTGNRTSKLSGALLQDLVFTPGLRPTVEPEIVRRFERKRQRLSRGYAPRSALDLLDWVKERVLIDRGEWTELSRAIHRDHGVDAADWLKELIDRLVWLDPPDQREPFLVALEAADRIVRVVFEQPGKTRVLHPVTWQPISDPLPPGRAHTDQSPREAKISLIGQWMQFYGPRPISFWENKVGWKSDRLHQIVKDMVDLQQLIVGKLVNGGHSSDICDSENFEILLRLARKASKPGFAPLDIEQLPLFLARHQGLASDRNGVDGLFESIQRLLCISVPAALWEQEIFPARLDQYKLSWLDTILSEGELGWFGQRRERVLFCFHSELDLLPSENANAAIPDDGMQPSRAGDLIAGTGKFSELAALFEDPQGRYDFGSLLQKSGFRPAELNKTLWDAVWQGRISNDGFSALRQGLAQRFRMPATRNHGHGTGRRRTRHRHISFRRWKATRPYAGNWFRVTSPEPIVDLLAAAEHKKEQVRLLLDRYGILFRELLHKEMPSLHWARVFRTLRLMEFSGEVLAGAFFNDIPGPQFVSPAGLRRLKQKMPSDAIFWMNAADPASLCGSGLAAFRNRLPRRLNSTHIVYHAIRLVLISQRYGRKLTFHVPDDCEHVLKYLDVLHHLLNRRFDPLRYITVQTINAQDAADSSYRKVLQKAFDVVADEKSILLYPLKR